jgi:hypothetical protein
VWDPHILLKCGKGCHGRLSYLSSLLSRVDLAFCKLPDLIKALSPAHSDLSDKVLIHMIHHGLDLGLLLFAKILETTERVNVTAHLHKRRLQEAAHKKLIRGREGCEEEFLDTK